MVSLGLQALAAALLPLVLGPASLHLGLVGEHPAALPGATKRHSVTVAKLRTRHLSEIVLQSGYERINLSSSRHEEMNDRTGPSSGGHQNG